MIERIRLFKHLYGYKGHLEIKNFEYDIRLPVPYFIAFHGYIFSILNNKRFFLKIEEETVKYIML